MQVEGWGREGWRDKKGGSRKFLLWKRLDCTLLPHQGGESIQKTVTNKHLKEKIKVRGGVYPFRTSDLLSTIKKVPINLFYCRWREKEMREGERMIFHTVREKKNELDCGKKEEKYYCTTYCVTVLRVITPIPQTANLVWKWNFS